MINVTTTLLGGPVYRVLGTGATRMMLGMTTCLFGRLKMSVAPEASSRPRAATPRGGQAASDQQGRK